MHGWGLALFESMDSTFGQALMLMGSSSEQVRAKIDGIAHFIQGMFAG